MSPHLKPFAFVLALFAFVSMAGARTEPTAAAEAPRGAELPVAVLELFTSQGCSSCPPAERVLTLLGSDKALRSRIVPLAFHVDYWNEGGWVDPLSSPEWTKRQEAYAQAFGTEDIYTPQMVVNGRRQLNGSDGEQARAEISASLEERPKAILSLTVSSEGERSLMVEVGGDLADLAPPEDLDLLVAVFESGLVTPVARGENRGRTLRNDFVVRDLEKAFSLGPKAGSRKDQKLLIKVDPRWKKESLGAAAFLQDPRSMRIYAAKALPVVR